MDVKLQKLTCKLYVCSKQMRWKADAVDTVYSGNNEAIYNEINFKKN